MTTTKMKENPAAAAVLAGNNGFSLISNEKLLQLYSSLVKCRMIEERVEALLERRQLAGRGIVAKGLEAAAVGVAIDLLPEDTVVASAPDFIVNFIKGDSLANVVSSLIASVVKPKPFERMNPALVAAMANKTEKNGRIAVAFHSEEPGASADWHEALTKAAADRLPMLFVSRSSLATGPAIGEVQSRRKASDLKARQYGIPAIPVDSSDVVAVYRVATEAIAHARKGNGATLIDCVTCSSEPAAEIDAIAKMEAYLRRKGLFREALRREVAAGFSRELDAASE